MAEKTAINIPIHITGFFTPHYLEDELRTGSTGAGLVLTPGIRVSTSPAGDSAVLVNGEETKIGPLEELLSKLPKTFHVSIDSPYPLGAGFGTSASITLGTSLLIWSRHRRWGLLKAAQEAHVAEVRARTGLGDVLSLYIGRGLVVRSKPGAPGVGEGFSVKTGGGVNIIAISLGRLSTSDMLRIYADKIRIYGQRAFKLFEKNPSLDNFFHVSWWFASNVGFLDEKSRQLVNGIRRRIIGASVKKRVMFIACDEDEVEDVIDYLTSYQIPRPYILQVNETDWISEEKLAYAPQTIRSPNPV